MEFPHRNNRQKNRFCSRACAYENIALYHPHAKNGVLTRQPKPPLKRPDCIVCGCPKPNHRGFCSELCRRAWAAFDQRCREADAHIWVRSCASCGAEFRVPYGSKRRRFCSVRCSLRHGKRERNRKYGSNHRQYARRMGSTVEYFPRLEIFERDGWRCGLCRGKIRRAARSPHPQSPTLDHIVPLSAGGGHTRANVQAAHFRCYYRRGATGLPS